MSINPKSELQDVEAWIKLVKEGQTSKVKNILNRIAVPYYLFTRKGNEEWLERLNFIKSQLEEEIKFNKYINDKNEKKQIRNSRKC